MKKIFGAAAVLALLAAGPTTSLAAGPCDFGVFMDFDADGFAYETTYNPANYHSTVNSTLKIVGHINLFCPPLAALNPAGPNEYTFVVTATSNGTLHFGPFGGFYYHETDYRNGTWAVYEGNPEDAPTDAGGMPALPSPLVPATFNNGTVILSGVFTGLLHTSISSDLTQANTNGSFVANYQATGGSYYPQVGNGTAIFQGNWCVWPEPAGCRPATYSAHPNGLWDLPPTTATNRSTWGALKALYK